MQSKFLRQGMLRCQVVWKAAVVEVAECYEQESAAQAPNVHYVVVVVVVEVEEDPFLAAVEREVAK
jgi:hypothetical protein